MSRRLIYVPFWEKELVELVEFLRANKYTESEVAAMEQLIDKENYTVES